jgi:UDP-N-acetylglucosamine--N-acetylmuramyl-(pentapeptide) pyrophosphoryl-undecaprenol N-acetylglucosamine transferase
VETSGESLGKVLLTGGGTAGHVTPNLALLPSLRARGFEVEYMGSIAGIERRLASEAGLPYHPVQTGKLRRYASLENLVDPFRILFGILQATWRIRRLRPRVVFSKGGFVGVPVAVGAWLNGVPVVVHESDLTPGLANRLCLPFASKICLSFRETEASLEGRDVVYTGTPVRLALRDGDRARGLGRFGLDADRKTVLVFGGSLGAQAINEQVRAALDALTSDLQILHVCGAGNLDEALEGREGYRQYEYLDAEFGDAFACADVVVSRAGANSLAELIALRKPAVVIPLPTAASRGDQIDNARLYAEKGYGLMLDQQDLSAASLQDALHDALSRSSEFALAMERAESHDPIERIVDLLVGLAQKR